MLGGCEGTGQGSGGTGQHRCSARSMRRACFYAWCTGRGQFTTVKRLLACVTDTQGVQLASNKEVEVTRN